jgi:DNA-binding NarL/FixJ family response regulator
MVALSAAEDALGDRDAALRWADRAAALAAERQLPLSVDRARIAHARLAGDAAAILAAADRMEGVPGASSDAHSARILAAEIGGDREVIVDALREVLDEAPYNGAHALEQAATRELRRLGVHARAKPTPGTGSVEDRMSDFTPREHQIAQLVSDGRSNKAVAAALFLSEKTIEHNLTNIYAKLGVKSRVELAAALARRTL